ncbi:MAG: hypothetical protein ABR976_09285 [Terracidiphilus sp.]|jgi:hypothetical protein
MSNFPRPNSWVSQESTATTQLTYALQLNPAPLTVSLAGRDPVLGSLQFVLTNSTASPIAVSSVEFTIQTGVDGSDLTPSTAGVDTSISDPVNWQIQPPGDITSGPATYSLLPMTGSSVTIVSGASVVVEIFNFATVENPGNSTIAIKEVAGAIGFTNFQVTTFPTGFYFNGLSATILSGSEFVPVAQVSAGATVTLVWNSSIVDLSSIAIYYSNAAQGQQKATPAEIGLWTSPTLTTDTVFTVVIDVSVAGGSPLTAALSTSVAIQNPALIAASVAAEQATVSGTLGVTGASTVGTLNASTLGVSGQSNLNNTSVSGTLSVTGASTVSALTVGSSFSASGLAMLTGGMQLGGPLAALQTAVAIQPGQYGPAPTDGFVAGLASSPTNSNPIPAPCWVSIFVTSGGVWHTAMGGLIPQLDYKGNYQGMIFQPGSLLFPVMKGNSFLASFSPSRDFTPDVFFYWIPLGVASSPEQMAALRQGDAEIPEQLRVALRHE